MIAILSARRLAAAIGIAGVVCLALLAGRAAPVSAHAVLVRSDPAANAKLPSPPTAISIYFSEPLEPKFSSAKLVDSSGRDFDDGGSRVDAGDPTHMTLNLKTVKPGIYTVAWTTLSKVDGHKIQGSYPIIVLNPDGSVPAGAPAHPVETNAAGAATTGPGDVVAYWLTIWGAVAIFGAGLFALAIALPAASVLESEAESGRLQIIALERRVLGSALALFLLGEAGQFALQLRQVGGVGSIGELLSTSFGEFLAIRLILGLIAAGCALALGPFGDAESRPPILGLLTLSGLGILACFSLTSHGAAVGDGAFWATIGDLLHLLSVGVWVGGLISLAVMLCFVARGEYAWRRLRLRAALVSRFSPLAAAAVTVLILTGVFNAVVEVPTLSSLIHTAYGRSLLIKLAAVLVLLLVAAVNAFYLRPQVAAAVEESGTAALARAQRLDHRLQRVVLAEATAAVVVLLVVGLLLIVPPSRDLAAQAAQAAAPGNGTSVYNNTATANDLTVQLTVDPNKVGLNTYRITLSDAQGPVSNASLVRLDLSFADPKFGTSDISLPSKGDGVYEATGANFAQVGRWRAAVVIRRPGKDDALTSFTVEVPDASGNLTINRVNQADPFASPSHLFTVDQLGGLALVLAGIVLLVVGRQLWELGPAAGAAGTFSGVAGVILGLTVFFALHQQGTVDYTLLANPVPVSNASVADGKALYAQNCAVCHGASGHGDGPAARGLNPQPVDLTVHVGLHADGVLWGWITYGIPRTAMPSWKDKLTDKQRWDIVNYLRTEFQTSAAGPAAPSAESQPSKLAAAAAWAAALNSGATHANP